MTLKHTPGPWEFVPAGKWYIGSGCGVQARTPEGPGFPTPNATGFYAIACPPPHGRDKTAEQEANARLIAEAPAMLDALRELVGNYIATFGDEGNDAPPAISNARVILARIDGGV